MSSDANGAGRRYRLGIDVGGTFTDFVIYDQQTGATSTFKVPTTPADPSVGILDGFRRLTIPIGEIESLTHGTTTATNALIERKGARTAFLTTEGFRDSLEIRRGNRGELYSVHWQPPPPLVRRRDRLEVRERVLADGTVVQPLDEDHLRDLVETLKVREIDAVAICFLHSYEHPEHELRVKEMVEQALPEAFVSASSEVTQEFREFERSSTVAGNAFVGPKVRRYMRNLARGLDDVGLSADVSIMQSNGGVCTLEAAGDMPIKLARSGPAGGAMALQQVAALTGVQELVGLDIGGTSADVCVVVDGRPRWTSPLMIDWGTPVLFPSVDVVSIGAGGGSIAWIDEGGILHMGPQSAGADPGPACYGKGGTLPTSTDAQVVLGRVQPQYFLGGEMTVSVERAADAIREHVAEPLGMSVPAAAEGMLKVLNNAMLEAARFLTLQKGYDPREFALVGFGGGGPVHVVELARELGMRQAIIPVVPGVLSAWGMLTVDMTEDRSRTVLRRRRALSLDALSAAFEELRESIWQALERAGVAREGVRFEYFFDLQYYGQTYSLSVPVVGLEDVSVTSAIRIDVDVMDRTEQVFHQEHEREYGHADPEQEVQVVCARVFGRAAVRKPRVTRLESAGSADATAAIRASCPVFFDGAYVDAPVYDRSALRPGHELRGPATIYESTSTTVLPPDAGVVVDEYGNLLVATGA